ncbi:hypothetical protein BDF19DRAFT_435956 [Syncephalis fuscata]|nr:hypothetical protein BDF19DRAFT_435956 [Syncephalis fuscata]
MELPFGDLDVEALADESIKKEPAILGPLPEYTPKQDTVGWLLLLLEDNTAFISAVKEKHGPNHVKSTIECLYYRRQYDQVVALGQQVLAVFDKQLSAKEVRVTSSSLREMVEIVCRAAMRINDRATVSTCIDRLSASTSNDPGVLLMVGKACQFVGQYSDAIKVYLRFLTMRAQDYTAWRHMGACLSGLSKADISAIDDDRLAAKDERIALCQLSLACYLHAMEVMRKSTWPNVDYIQTRYERELTELNTIVKELQNDININGIELLSNINYHHIRSDRLNSDIFMAIDTELKRGNTTSHTTNEEVEAEKSSRNL